MYTSPIGAVSTETLNKIGTKVSANDMKPGDVIFFDTYKHDGHVGIVIDKTHSLDAKQIKVFPLKI